MQQFKKYPNIKKNTYNLQLGRKAEFWGKRKENNAKFSWYDKYFKSCLRESGVINHWIFVYKPKLANGYIFPFLTGQEPGGGYVKKMGLGLSFYGSR